MNTDHERMLEELLSDESDTMNAWEIGFIQSLDRKRQYELSDKQVAALEKTWAKVFGG